MTHTFASLTDTSAQFTQINVNSPVQKRALSYAVTITGLFNKVMQQKMPADRILAEYFREHKKHGSKDRKIIRESVFGLFRWWGWLQQLGDVNNAQDSLLMLSFAAAFERQPYHPISQAWLTLSQSTCNLDAFYQLNSDDDKQAPLSIIQLEKLFKDVSQVNVNTKQLVPKWFWQVCPVEDDASQLALIQALSTRPPIWARAQHESRAKVTEILAEEQITATASEYFTGAMHLGVKSINLPAIKSYQNGLFEIQDLGSQVIGQICQPKPDEHWWDTCSGAGGKTLQLRSLMLAQNPQSTGSIVASDIRRKPLEELHKRAKRSQFNHISTQAWQSDALPVEAEYFDGVLVDAPCSCIGTWRRNPDMRWLDDRSCVDDKTQLQLDILTRSAKAVKSGGKLVYATCSLSPLENQSVVEAFLATSDEFTLAPLTHPFTQQPADMLTVWPQQANSDGMFVAVLIKS